MRIFITGATGFAGSHLVDRLLIAGHDLFVLVHDATSHQELPASAKIQQIPGDLLNLSSIKMAVAGIKPDIIYHLAGQASPAISWKDPAFTLAVNAGGTANLLEAAVAFGQPRVVIVTSAEIYGLVNKDMLPLAEDTVPEPRHPYGISKMAAGQLAPIYWQRYQLPVIEARPFNHVGPRQTLGFVVPDFASQLAAIKLGQKQPVMSVGNLEAERDFTDVRDVAAAYVALAEKGRPGEAYFICSGKAVSIYSLLQILSDLAQVDVQVTFDPTRMRPSDTPSLFGSFAKIEEHTGWRPQISLRQSLADALQDWIERLDADQK
jgi:GDP-4-dehydro-6-deoxy-D-mannose reductase